MGRSLIFSGSMSMRISHLSRSSLPLANQFSFRTVVTKNFGHGLCSRNSFKSTTTLRTKAVVSEVSDQKHYPRIGAKTTGPISPAHLLQVVEAAAKTGAEVQISSLYTYNYPNLLFLLEDWFEKLKPLMRVKKKKQTLID